MKNLVLITAHDHFFQTFLTAKTLYQYGLPKNMDVVYYANSTKWSQAELGELFKTTLPQHDVKVITTSKNISHRWGGWESVADSHELWNEYDVVYQFHPDIFFTRGIHPLIKDATEHPETFVLYYWPWGVEKSIASIHFMLFSFKPQQLRNRKFFRGYMDKELTGKYKWPETLLEQLVKIQDESYAVVKGWQEEGGINVAMLASKKAEDIQQYKIPDFVHMTEEDYEYLDQIIAMTKEKESRKPWL